MYLEKWLQNECQASKKLVRRYAQKGQITINGERCFDLKRSIEPAVHHVTVAGRSLTTEQAHVYYLLHKPQGVVSAVVDAQHPTVIDCLDPQDRTPGCTHVGRLDRSTEGLLLITDNGPLVRRLAFPQQKIEKIYQAQVLGQLTEQAVEMFAQGIIFHDGTQCAPAKLKRLSYDPQSQTSWAEVTLTEGKFHQVKKMFRVCGTKVTFLKRVQFGPFTLPENLEPGQYRALRQEELLKIADLL